MIAINPFVRRQTESSPFTHWTLTDEELLRRVRSAMGEGHFEQGYREGVRLVHVEPDGFYSPVVELAAGDVLVGSFTSRRDGEAPRKQVHVSREGRTKSRAAFVDVVVYHHDVLAADGDNSTDEPWEIVSVNARITPEDAPIDPDTLIANHFDLSGGTATNMTPEQFEAALRESVLYWRGRALLSAK